MTPQAKVMTFPTKRPQNESTPPRQVKAKSSPRITVLSSVPRTKPKILRLGMMPNMFQCRWKECTQESVSSSDSLELIDTEARRTNPVMKNTDKFINETKPNAMAQVHN